MNDDQIRPFRLQVPRPTWTTCTTGWPAARIRWLDELLGVGWRQGVPLG